DHRAAPGRGAQAVGLRLPSPLPITAGGLQRAVPTAAAPGRPRSDRGLLVAGSIAMTATAAPIIELDSVSKRFPVGGGRLSFSGGKRAMVHAVEQVSLALYPGQTLGVVGESGCGKTTTAKLILRLEQPSEGRILFHGRDITDARGEAARAYRRAVQAVFQNPASSLSPRMRVRELIVEPLI